LGDKLKMEMFSRLKGAVMQSVFRSAKSSIVLYIEGNLESESVPAFRASAASLPPGRNVVFDLQDVLFVDSAGLGALIGAVRRVREAGGDAVICRPRPSVRRALRFTAIDRSVRVVDHITQAQGYFLAPAAAA
jgi:anti-sigma B factor antagonist